jgi:hypothetical protein
MSNRTVVVVLAAALAAPLVACVEAEDGPEPDLATEESDLITRICVSNTSVTIDEGTKTLATGTYHVASGAPLLLEAVLTARATSSPHPMQGLYIDCTGPVAEHINTTQNAFLGEGAITTRAHIVLTTPGTYSCSLQTSTTHEDAALHIDSGCLSATQMAAQDWPNWPTDSPAADEIGGRGFRIYRGDPQYVLRHDYDIDATTSKLAIRADIELTNIFATGSGIGDPPAGDPILACNDMTGENKVDATTRVRVEATQRAVGGYCGSTVKGPNTDTVIRWGSHHQKVFGALDLPISHAAGCLPRVNVKVYVSALGGNDLCFHESRYSNTYVYPL